MTTIKIAQDRSGEQGGIGNLLATLFLIPLILWSGFVLMTLWNWFIPETFRGLPTLSFIQAIGLGLVIEFATLRTSMYIDKSKTVLERALASIILNLFMGVLFLIVGFIFHLFV